MAFWTEDGALLWKKWKDWALSRDKQGTVENASMDLNICTCQQQMRSFHLRKDRALLRGNTALLRKVGALWRGNTALLRKDRALLRGNTALLRKDGALRGGGRTLVGIDIYEKERLVSFQRK